MKTVYIPKGETVCYESLETERLVINGSLNVAGGVKARIISGCGSISAGSVEADVIRIDSLETGTVICKRLIAKRVQAPEVFASESAAVSCFLSAAYVETGRLTVAISEIDEVKADEVINLPRKKRFLFGTLLASALRSLWTSLTAPKACANEPVDTMYTAQELEAAMEEQTSEPESADSSSAQTELEAEPEPADEELNRVVGLFKLLRECGYTLRVVPGTPEENAPDFDFDTETIIRPAA